MSEHILPPAQCTTNTPTFTDSTITANSTKVRKVHLDELRSKLNLEFTRRYIANSTFTDSTITANVTKVRKIHIDELRTELGACKTGRAESGYCPEDDSVCMDFTDPTITANTTAIKKVHFDEMRSKLQSLMTSCICETEQCAYCSDCGYAYQTYVCACQKGCYCDNSKYSGGCTYTYYVWTYLCGSINSGGEHPKKSWNGSAGVAWDGYVPWAWGDGIPVAAINWTNYWTCKCNPFTW